MINKTINTLEFNKVLKMLAEYAISDSNKAKILEFKPILNETKLRLKQTETSEAKSLLENVGMPPISTIKEFDKFISKLDFEGMLDIEELENLAIFINTCNRLKKYLKKAENMQMSLPYMGDAIVDLTELYEKIYASVNNGMILDSASSDLRDIRRKIENQKTQINSKLEQILRANKKIFSDNYILNKNNHLVLAVKKEYRGQIKGSIIEQSNTGATYFIEPEQVSEMQSMLSELCIDEENEVIKILYILSGMVIENKDALKANIKIMEELDFIFAKAKLSIQMKAFEPCINTQRYIKIEEGRHPLLNSDNVVPIDFEIGNGINGIVITGPNTGGKTVTLKTIGLFSLMAQSGLHIPAKSANICMNDIVLCDIGDGQDIESNLSTFSSHITNVIEILKNASDESLVLLDELGSGTDPQEGMGIAISILEELRVKNCLFVATTHYPKVKDYTEQANGIINARMLFDKETLRPLYKLQIGEAGESCALYIAKKLGMPRNMLERAYEQAYGKKAQTNMFVDGKSQIEQNMNKKVEKTKEYKSMETNVFEFNMGDSVNILPNDEIGIVYKTADEKGMVCVQVKGEKVLINHKRLKIKNKAEELYPPDYDFSIIFDSKENRKARHDMSRKHVEGLVIEEKM